MPRAPIFPAASLLVTLGRDRRAPDQLERSFAAQADDLATLQLLAQPTGGNSTMKRKRGLSLIALAVALCGGADPGAAELSVGDAAPDFTLQGSDGVEHRLRDYVGKQAVVIAWFPKAFTPG